jgi:hypothetical protein
MKPSEKFIEEVTEEVKGTIKEQVAWMLEEHMDYGYLYLDAETLTVKMAWSKATELSEDWCRPLNIRADIAERFNDDPEFHRKEFEGLAKNLRKLVDDIEEAYRLYDEYTEKGEDCFCEFPESD